MNLAGKRSRNVREYLTLQTCTPPNLDLTNLEAKLSFNRPFGGWQYIHTCTVERYQRRLQNLLPFLASVESLQVALGQTDKETCFRVLGDPVVRTAINQALAHFKLHEAGVNLELAQAALACATECLVENRAVGPLARGIAVPYYLPGVASHTWVWTEERVEDCNSRIFRNLYQLQEDNRSLLSTPEPEMQTLLAQGVNLLMTLLPQLAQSVFYHVHLLAVVAPPTPEARVPFESFTSPTIPATIFLGPKVFHNPWQVAESILHEAAHQKWYDLRHSHAMLRSGYSAETSIKIPAIWHEGDEREWSACRATAAFHVYVHLVLFFRVVGSREAELVGTFGPLHVDSAARAQATSAARAYYLGQQIKAGCWSELGLGGQRFVEWLFTILTTLTPPIPTTLEVLKGGS